MNKDFKFIQFIFYIIAFIMAIIVTLQLNQNELALRFPTYTPLFLFIITLIGGIIGQMSKKV